jgi:hypothetical protein
MYIFFFASVALLAGWGIAHLFPTRTVVKGFGAISEDNRKTITMEWINEGATLIFTGGLIALVTIVDYSAPVSKAVYLYIVFFLNVLSAISLFTGFRIHSLPFRLCPFIFTGSSILILLGMFL